MIKLKDCEYGKITTHVHRIHLYEKATLGLICYYTFPFYTKIACEGSNNGDLILVLGRINKNYKSFNYNNKIGSI